MENIISIIVVTYNQQYTISRTLDSILAQRCSVPIEIVIGEDCSTDNTRAICESYQQRYPQIIRLMPQTVNKGVARNYFDCMLACKGKYIADCAGDDFWTDTEKLQKEYDAMESDSELTLVHTNWNYYNEITHLSTPNFHVPFPAPKTPGSMMLESILTQNKEITIHSCTMLYRSDVARKCYKENSELFNNPQLPCEDLLLIFMLAKEGKVAYLPCCTLSYSIGNTTVSSTQDDRRQFRFALQTAMLSFQLANKFGIRTMRTNAFFTDKVFALMMHAFRCKDRTMLNEALLHMTEWQVIADWKIEIARLIMSQDILWDIMFEIRKAFVQLKQLLKN